LPWLDKAFACVLVLFGAAGLSFVSFGMAR